MSVSIEMPVEDEEREGLTESDSPRPTATASHHHLKSTVMALQATEELEELHHALQNPMLEHSSEYVVNMWKVYQHLVVGRKTKAGVYYLVWYLAYMMYIVWVLGHLPVPAVMLQHQEAVTDLLLGEEFDAETTHIYKSYYDVMTVEEMWQWAQGPMAAALLVDGAPDGKMDAIVGTNWLLGPVRIRLERSVDYPTQETCNRTLTQAFGPSMGKKLMGRGIQCTSEFRTDNPSTWHGSPFLDLSTPLVTLGTCSDACASATASRAACESAAAGECLYTPAEGSNAATCRAPEDCAEWGGDLDSCEGSNSCTFAKRSFIDAFPQWVEAQRSGKCFKGDCTRAYCCSVAGCFDDADQQLESIQKTGEDDDHACSIAARSANLTWNPQESYKSTVKSDTTTSDNLWAQRRNFGDGGYHIDLPGDSETMVPMLQALEELGFADQFARSVDFQFVLINPNNFTLSGRTSSQNPVTVVSVELNFRFSASGFLSKYDRIQAVQLKPFHFVFGSTEGSDDDSTFIQLSLFFVPVVMILLELQELGEVGIKRYFSSGWNLFEVAYISVLVSAMNAITSYIDAESSFLKFYEDEASQDLYNDALPLRARYKETNKLIGLAAFVTVVKFLKYVRIFRSTTVMWNTMDKAKWQLLQYLVVMLVIVGAFALLSVMMWGYTSKTFHNIPTAVFALVRVSAGEGELDYEELKRGDASFTPIVFMSFVVFVAIIGMNLMIAIITDYYEDARSADHARKADTEWVRETFSSQDEYEDYYRGKGLWNEPVTDSILGAGDAWSSLHGTWNVKPIPKGCGPRKWDRGSREVQPLHDTQKYPFVLQRSSIVHIRYRVQSHEHTRGAEASDDPKDQKGSNTPVYPNSPEAFDEERERTKANPLPQALSCWMSATQLSQLQGIPYLELLKDPSIVVGGERKCISDLSRSELEHALTDFIKVSLLDLWNRYDKDHNGELNREELAQAIDGEMNKQLTHAQLEVLMTAMDTDKSGTITKEEFIAQLDQLDDRPSIFQLLHLSQTELQDRLRERLASALAAGTKNSIMSSLKPKPGDSIHLGTPSEGGIAGDMTLEFQKLMPVRRASKRDKLEVNREIHAAKQKLDDALLEGHKVGRCREHAEELIRKYGDEMDGAQLPDFLRRVKHCKSCAQAAESDLTIAECEEELQRLHEARGKLEGVERIMVFRVKQVDAWQKFRPMDVKSDDAAGQLAHKLKEAGLKNTSAGTEAMISLDQVLDVLVETLAPAMKHEWRHGNTLLEELLAKTEEQRHEYAERQGVADEKIQEANGEPRKLAEAILERQGDRPLDQEAWLAKKDQDGKTRRELIREQCTQAMKDMAEEEQRSKFNTSVEDTPAEKKQKEPLTELTNDNGNCDLRALVDIDSGHPKLSSVMILVLKTVQRIDALDAHTPLLEVDEDTDFGMKLSLQLQARLFVRQLSNVLQTFTRSTWRKYQRSISGKGLCSKMLQTILFPRHLLKIPLRFIFDHCYFHRKVEADIDSFLHDKCMAVSTHMPSNVSGSLKLEMDTFMSEHNSIRLSDFMYQLQYYRWKTKESSPLVQLRRLTHACLRKCVPGYCSQQLACLRKPMAKRYSILDEERAMEYLLFKYSDFIDRRRGSVPGAEYNSGGVLLHPTVLDILEQERDDAMKTKAEEEEELKKDLQKMFKEEVQVLASAVKKEIKEEVDALRAEVDQIKAQQAQAEAGQVKSSRTAEHANDAPPIAAETVPLEEPQTAKAKKKQKKKKEEAEDLVPESAPSEAQL